MSGMINRKRDNFFIICAVVVAIFFGTVWLIQRASCYSSWQASGMRVRWGIIEQCQIEVAPGKWIPEGAYRELPKE